MDDEDVVCECGNKEFTELGWMGKTQHIRCRKCGLDTTLQWALVEATFPKEDILEKQAWTPETKMELAERFIEEQGLAEDYRDFLVEIALEGEEENEVL